jgi:hypothetical protein
VLRKPLILKCPVTLLREHVSHGVSDVRANDILVTRHAVTLDVTKISSEGHKMISGRSMEEMATWQQGLVTRISRFVDTVDGT